MAETVEKGGRLGWLPTWIYERRILLWVIIFVVDLLLLTVLVLYLDHARASAKGTDTPLTWYVLLLREALFAVSLACLLALLSETPIFANYLQNRFADLLLDSDNKLMERFERSASVHLLEQLTSTSFFRTLSLDSREKIEHCLLESQLEKSTPSELSTLLQNLVKARRGIRIWRASARWVLRYEEMPAHPHAYRIHVEKFYKYHNCGPAPETIDQKFATLCDRISGISDQDLCSTDILQIDDRDCLGLHPQTIEDQGHRVLFSRTVPITIPARGVDAFLSVRERATTVYRHAVPFVSVVLHPMYCFDITIRHPSSVIPILYVFGSDFGAGRPLIPPVIDEHDVHQWTYKGWVLPSQGFLMLFTRRA